MAHLPYNRIGITETQGMHEMREKTSPPGGLYGTGDSAMLS